MKVNLAGRFFYNRELYKPAQNPVTLPDEAVEDLDDNAEIVEGSAAVKARFAELKEERASARTFSSKDEVGKLTHRLGVLEEQKGGGGKDHSKDLEKLTKTVADLTDLVGKLQDELAGVKAAHEASTVEVNEQLAKLSEPKAEEAKPPLEPPVTPTGKKISL